MKNLIIEEGDKSLAVDLRMGILNFSGRSIINDPRKFFTPIKDWVDVYVHKAPKLTIINIKLEYMDTASAKSFHEILDSLTKINSSRKVIVNWHYSVTDPEIMELGEIIAGKIGFDFVYHECGD
ncbi:MAG: DUF1987 domain-containing protein [Bacteroidales bacterium]|nr:DUF1987 domain-containing protein [Saprospiraceae bacterium]MCF8381561.1 DUF1987 domain-containing protein [Bacteroidales bacterium]